MSKNSDTSLTRLTTTTKMTLSISYLSLWVSLITAWTRFMSAVTRTSTNLLQYPKISVLELDWLVPDGADALLHSRIRSQHATSILRHSRSRITTKYHTPRVLILITLCLRRWGKLFVSYRDNNLTYLLISPRSLKMELKSSLRNFPRLLDTTSGFYMLHKVVFHFVISNCKF